MLRKHCSTSSQTSGFCQRLFSFENSSKQGLIPELFSLDERFSICPSVFGSYFIFIYLTTTSGRPVPECTLRRVMSSKPIQDEQLTRDCKQTTNI